MLIFVYGTLMQGYNNHRLLDNSRYIGAASIKGLCYSLSCDMYPVLVDGDNSVVGEVYEVKSISVLMRLDYLEGYRVDSDFGMYLRRKAVAELEDGTSVDVEYYKYNQEVPSTARLLKSGEKWCRL